MDTIGKRIRFARERRGWSLSQAASECNISKAMLWEVEHNNKGITIAKLAGVAQGLDVPLEFLATGERPPEEYKPSNTFEIPSELAEMAQKNEANLTFREIAALLHLWRTARGVMTKEAWHTLYELARAFGKE